MKVRITCLKNIISIIILTFAFSACQNNASLSGKLEGTTKKDIKIYLIKPETLQDVAFSYVGTVIDTAVVHTDGSFKFHNLPETTEPVLLEMALQQPGEGPKYLQTKDPINSNYMPILWQSGKSMHITASADQFQKSFSIKHPSENNKALLHLRDVNEKAYQTYLAGKHWQVEEGSQLLEKEHAVFQYQTKLMNFADSTPCLMPALVALRWVSPESDYERVPEFLVRQCAKWKKERPDHPWVKELCKESNPADLPVLAGSVFPDLRFPLLTSDTLSLNDLLGSKLTIIDVWASWCAPCRKENRDVLVPLWNEYHNQGLHIVAYSLESDKSVWRAAAAHDGADHWYQASDLKGDDAPFLKKIRIMTIPANFILNDKGVVMAKNLHGKRLMDFVKNYMKE
jgi:thiol-disulfide isomerase/thioredoxin